MQTQPETHALWLMPRGDLYRRLSLTITQFSQVLGTPRFEPHVTLVGGLTLPKMEIISQAAKLARLLQPFPIQLAEPAGTDDYFRCLFLRVEPTEPVIAAHQQAMEVLQQRDEYPYHPHLSLLYGQCPEETKKKIIATIGEMFKVEYIAESMQLYDTSGPPTGWHRVRSLSFG